VRLYHCIRNLTSKRFPFLVILTTATLVNLTWFIGCVICLDISDEFFIHYTSFQRNKSIIVIFSPTFLLKGGMHAEHQFFASCALTLLLCVSASFMSPSRESSSTLYLDIERAVRASRVSCPSLCREFYYVESRAHCAQQEPTHSNLKPPPSKFHLSSNHQPNLNVKTCK